MASLELGTPRARRGAVSLLFLSLTLAACAAETSEGAPGAPSSPAAPAPTAPPASTEPTQPSGPAVCASPAAPAPTAITRDPKSATPKITLPADIAGSTTEGIDFQYFDFTLTDVARVRLSAAVKDFADTAEKTGIGFEIRNKTIDVNHAHARAHIDPSTPKDDDASPWLYPGDYQIVMSRATYASANAATPTLPHAYTLTIAIEMPPVEKDGCAMPADAISKEDVRSTPACNAWCKKLPQCGTGCRDECEIPVGQCALSVQKQLECMEKASFECVSTGGGHGFSIDAICELDPSVCPAGTIRQ